MQSARGRATASSRGPLIDPAAAAEAIERERCFVFPHPEVRDFKRRRQRIPNIRLSDTSQMQARFGVARVVS
jgi:hypothetical protein